MLAKFRQMRCEHRAEISKSSQGLANTYASLTKFDRVRPNVANIVGTMLANVGSSLKNVARSWSTPSPNRPQFDHIRPHLVNSKLDFANTARADNQQGPPLLMEQMDPLSVHLPVPIFGSDNLGSLYDRPSLRRGGTIETWNAMPCNRLAGVSVGCAGRKRFCIWESLREGPISHQI